MCLSVVTGLAAVVLGDCNLPRCSKWLSLALPLVVICSYLPKLKQCNSGLPLCRIMA